MNSDKKYYYREGCDPNSDYAIKEQPNSMFWEGITHIWSEFLHGGGIYWIEASTVDPEATKKALKSILGLGTTFTGGRFI